MKMSILPPECGQGDRLMHYGSIDFDAIDKFLRKTFSYADTSEYKIVGLGKSYYIGDSSDACVKLDLFYIDKFIRKITSINGIRMASGEDIIAMKIDVISKGGKKKDFCGKASDCDHLSPEYTDHPWLELNHSCINNYKKVILTGQMLSTEPAFAHYDKNSDFDRP